MVDIDGRNYGSIQKASTFKTFVERMIKENKPFGFDIESGYTGEDKEKVSLLPFHPEWVMTGFSFTNSVKWARYVPVNHDDASVNIDDETETARWLWKLLQTGKGVAHNAHFELIGLSRWFRDILWDDPELGEAVRKSQGLYPVLADTMIQAHEVALYDPILVGIGLKSLTKNVFGHQMTEFLDLFPDVPKNKKKFVRFNTRVLNDQVIEYACEDSVWCLALYQKHSPLLKDSFIDKIETELLQVVSRMELEGLVLDWELVSVKLKEAQVFKEKMAEEIFLMLSEELGEVVQFNLNSVPQLANILYERLGLPVKMRSKTTGKPSTSEKALRSIAQESAVVRRILEYREVVKLIGSYLKKYDTELNYAGNGRAYPNHKQTGALTGRFAVDGVSYQQWPKPYHYELKDGTTFDMSFRDLLLSPEDFRIVGYDFSQVELRVMAGLAQEKAMLKAFRDGTDIHVATYAAMNGVPIESVNKKQRATGKTLNFAVTFGSGPKNIAEMLSTKEHPVSTEDAEQLLVDYYAGFPDLDSWMSERRYEGRTTHTVYTPFGRKFTVWEYDSPKKFIQEKGDRMCVNAPVQGGAADYMKIGMVRAQRAIDKAGLSDKIKIVMTVHDALEMYVHKSVTTQQVIDLISSMTSFPVDGFPEIKADWHEGETLGTLIEVNLDENKQITSYAIDGDAWKGYTWETYEEAKHYRHHPEELKKEKVEEARESHTVILTMTSMPTKAQWAKFIDLVRSPDGKDSLVLNTPQGSKTSSIPMNIPKESFNKISSILGGASVKIKKTDGATDE